MSVATMMGSGANAAQLTRLPATQLLHGSLRMTDGQDGWVRPWRLAEPQVRALSSVGAWHPGLYRQMAAATAGICVEFLTDATTVALEVRLDEEPRGTARVLDPLAGGDELRPPFDGVSCDIDDTHLPPVMPAPAVEGEGAAEVSVACFSLGEREASSVGFDGTLPGLSAPHHVRIWLPCMRGCMVRDVLVAGALIEPVPARDTVMVLGDSIAQGFVAGDPALAWPSLLASELGLDLVNQGIGGQVFQPGVLAGLSRLDRPRHVIVELGINYRFEQCQASMVARDVRAFLYEVSRLWPGVPTWVITPTGHRERLVPTHGRSCFADVPQLIADAAARHGQMRVLGGPGLLPGKRALLMDSDHPNASGHAFLAERLAATIERRGGALVRSLNPSERVFARDEETGRFVPSPARGEELDFGDGQDAGDVLDAGDGLTADEWRVAKTTPDPDGRALAGPTAEPKPEPEPEPTAEPKPELTSEPNPPVVAPAVIIERAGIPSDGLAPGARREAVIERLERGPDRAFQILECLRRGVGEVLHTSPGATLMRIPRDGNQFLFAPDHELARRILAGMDVPRMMTLCEPGLEQDALKLQGLDTFDYFHLALPVSGLLPPDEAPTSAEQLLPWQVDPYKAERILTLDESFAEQLAATYGNPPHFLAEDFRWRLAEGTLLGGFTDDFELVGYVGEQVETCVGILEVFPEHRRQGWATALQATKMNEHLARGFIPWSQVMEGNEASLALHERLGMRITLASEQCFCSRSQKG